MKAEERLRKYIENRLSNKELIGYHFKQIDLDIEEVLNRLKEIRKFVKNDMFMLDNVTISNNVIKRLNELVEKVDE